MLTRLRIQNIVLIEEAELEFCGGLNILSGETGAGKSVLIDCLMLLFGARLDKNLLRFGAESGVVEGMFSLSQAAQEQLVEMGFDADDTALISRRITKDGKNEIRLNGRSATASMLKSLMAYLVDIYGQNDFQYYADKNAQLKVLDYYLKDELAATKNELAALMEQYRTVAAELNEIGDLSQREQAIDFLRYQIDEIDKANVYDGEEQELTDKRRLALNAENIITLINDALRGLDESGLASAGSCIKKLESYGGVYSELSERLTSVIIETEDIYDALNIERGNCRFDPDDLERLEERLGLVRAIKRKYGDYDKMRTFYTDSKSRLDKLENASELYERLSAQKTALIQKLYILSTELSQIRKNGAVVLAQKLEGELRQLGMEGAKFEIVFEPLPAQPDCEKSLSAKGLDSVEFYLSANVGQPLKPFIKIVSGGEMSRFMLALKVVIGGMDMIPTLIFDEIDSGVSGKVGQEVAKKLARIALGHQVLCVTHLPQIAAMAEKHFLIRKEVRSGATVTLVQPLTRAGMVDEVSRLSGGIGISDTSLSTAAEMKAWSDEYKKSIAR